MKINYRKNDGTKESANKLMPAPALVAGTASDELDAASPAVPGTTVVSVTPKSAAVSTFLAESGAV